MKDVATTIFECFAGKVATINEIKLRCGLSDNEAVNGLKWLVQERLAAGELYGPNSEYVFADKEKA